MVIAAVKLKDAYSLEGKLAWDPLSNSRGQRGLKKIGLKLNIQKTKIMVSGVIASWEINGETVETVSDFIFLGSKITSDGDCSHEIDRKSPESWTWG